MSDINPVALPRDESDAQPTYVPSPTQAVLDFESDKPLVCNRDQTGDTTCEACQ